MVVFIVTDGMAGASGNMEATPGGQPSRYQLSTTDDWVRLLIGEQMSLELVNQFLMAELYCRR